MSVQEEHGVTLDEKEEPGVLCLSSTFGRLSVPVCLSVCHQVQSLILRGTLTSCVCLFVCATTQHTSLVLCRYPDTTSNLPMYTTDYSALFVDTIGRLAQQVRVRARVVLRQ